MPVVSDVLADAVVNIDKKQIAGYGQDLFFPMLQQGQVTAELGEVRREMIYQLIGFSRKSEAGGFYFSDENFVFLFDPLVDAPLDMDYPTLIGPTASKAQLILCIFPGLA